MQRVRQLRHFVLQVIVKLIRFSKTDNAVDSHFKADNPRVLVKPDEVPVSPIYPEDPKFWDEFQIVLERVSDAKNGSRANHIADCFERDLKLRTAAQCAEAVHNDWPSDLMLVAAKDAVKNGEWRDLGLEGEFTDRIVLLNRLIAVAGHEVSPSSFCYKDKMRMPRPEEVAGAIIRGEIEAPRRIQLMLRDHPDYRKMETDQRAFTMFPEGSPPHGSSWAMHSAAAAAEGFVIKIMVSGVPDLVDKCTINMSDFRMDAGVHYPHDNDIACWAGQESVARWLPEYLVSLGADQAKLDAAMADAYTDWLNAN